MERRLLFCLVLLTIPSLTIQMTECPDGYNEVDGRCFFISNVEKNFDDSKYDCQSRGGSLVVIDNVEDRDAAMEGSSKPVPYWISRESEDVDFHSDADVLNCYICEANGTITPIIREFRGVWVVTAFNLNWPSRRGLSTDEQQRELRAILDLMVEVNLNVIVFQVRPAGDAFYNSEHDPWSYYLTGRQGQAPAPLYDPLAFAIEESHRRGIELHAWFNPYRARSKTEYDLDDKNMAIRFPQYKYEYDGLFWMDPGARAVEDHVYRVIIDVVRRYDIDGIHLDDYFYPYPKEGEDFPDSATYESYQASGGPLSKPDWRRDNVNRLVSRLYTGIHAVKSHVQFSISPFGIYRPGMPEGIVGFDQYGRLYADPKLWLQQGWVDYLAPQIYWAIDAPQQSYPALLDWWLDQNTMNRHIYAGNALYKINPVPDWPVSEITNQVELSRERRERLSLGNIMYNIKQFQENAKGVVDAFKNLYEGPALTPAMTWLGANAPAAPSGVQVNSGSITWSEDESGAVRFWALYRQNGDNGSLILVKVLGAEITTFAAEPGTYILKAVDKVGNESDGVTVEVP